MELLEGAQQALGEHAQGEPLGFGHGVVARRTICENARKLRRFRKPAAVVFQFTLNTEVHDQLRQCGLKL